MIEMTVEQKRNLYRAVLVFIVILSVFYIVRILSEFKSFQAMDNYGGYSITLTGHGEVQAVPDIATVSFTIRKDGKTVKEAQDAVAAVEKPALDSLKANGVEDKDIKTTNASFNPKYEYKRTVCPQPASAPATDGMTTMIAPAPYYCGEGKQVLTGYEAYESIMVKVRKADDAGKIMQALGGLGVTDLNGPNFAIDDEDALKAQARKQAIEEAKAKAEVLADDLGVNLGKILSFTEDGMYPPMPYYAMDGAYAKEMSVQSAPAVLPKGENTITSDVSITYEIK